MSRQQVGLGKILESWVGSGKNLPISAAQVERVFGDGMLGDLAAKAGLDKSQTASALSGLLPQVIDKLSPQGAMPSGKDLGGLLASVGKLLGWRCLRANALGGRVNFPFRRDTARA